MKQQLDLVKLFHETFKHPVASEPTAELDNSKSKANLVKQRETLRFDLMREENEEYLEAVHNNDIIGIADALGDQLYILCGTILEHGLQNKIVQVFEEIQKSNMSKLGEDGKPIYREDGKIMKGPNYFTPDIKSVLDGGVLKLSKLTPANKTIISIAALSTNEVIGIDGEIPWKQSEDMKRFKEKTLGKHIIMGRKTFESLPFLLPNRTHIVITRNKDLTILLGPKEKDSVLIVNTLQEAIDLCPDNETSYVIGGGEIYREAMPIVDELEITMIHTKIDWKDTQVVTKFPPAIENMGQFKIVTRTDFKSDEKNQYDYSFMRLVRK